MADDSPASGYGKPPAEHQFQKGKSGNPKGRPKRKPKPTGINFSLPELVLQEAERSMTISDDGKLVKTTRGEALMRSMFVSALRGNVQAQKTLVPLLAEAFKSKAIERQRATWVATNDPHEAARQYRAMLDATGSY